MPDINFLGTKASKTSPKEEKEPKYAVELTKPDLNNRKEPPKKFNAKSGGFLSSLKSLFRKKEQQPKAKIKIVQEERKSPPPPKRNNSRNGLPAPNNRPAPKNNNHFANNRKPVAPPPPPSPKRPIPKKQTKPTAPTKPLVQEGNIKYTEAPTTTSSLLDVNLIPQEVLDKLKPRKKLISLGFFTLGTIVFIVLVYVGMVVYQANLAKKTEEVNQEIVQVEEQIVNYQTIKVEAQRVNQKINRINSLLDEHIYWSAFLDTLALYTIPNVYYQSIAGDVSGAVTLSAVAKSYADIAHQLIVFRSAEDFIESVVISSGSGKTESDTEEGAAGVNFSISLTIISDVFYIVDD